MPQPQGENSPTGQLYQDDEGDSQNQMPPPRILQASQQHKDKDTKEEEHQPDPHAVSRSQPVARYISDSTPTISRLTPNPIPNGQHLHPTRERTRKVRDRSTGPPQPSHFVAPGAELLRKRQEYALSISKTNRNSTGAALGHYTREKAHEEQFDKDGASEHRRLSDNGMEDPYLDSLVLSAKKPTGTAPVAPMLHTRKDGGGVNGGSRTGRHGY